MALTPEERHAINDLFARLQAHGPAEKDGEAEALINQLIRRTPDSAYMLVQCVLIEEAQVAELEERIRDLESQLAGGGSRPASRGGFLGARRGSASMSRDDYDDDRRYDDRRSDDRRSGIPPIGSRSGPSSYDDDARASSWSGGRERPTPGGRPGIPQREQQGGGGFFRTAATMAAGVAGGALLANSLGGLFGGQKGEAQAGQGDGKDAGHDDTHDNDPGNYDADHHDAGGDGGGWDLGMDDFDI